MSVHVSSYFSLCSLLIGYIFYIMYYIPAMQIVFLQKKKLKSLAIMLATLIFKLI